MNFSIQSGLPASIAGIPVAQSGSGEVDRARSETAAQRRAAVTDAKAEKAAGIGEADGTDHEVDERDADGRRLWEAGPAGHKKRSAGETPDSDPADHHSRDLTGDSGGQLDLTG
jgi:hypothetical protein